MLNVQEHRPWKLSDRPWVMTQIWSNLLFVHWPIPIEQITNRLPNGLQVDTYEGQAWIGFVPFHMGGLQGRGMPYLPYTPAFPELNVRTYVTDGEKPGVYFFSLDAASPLVVKLAKRFFHLPYRNAEMTLRRDGAWSWMKSKRVDPQAPPAKFEARYRPITEPFTAVAGTLAHWLTERYCFYSNDQKGRLYRCDIHHLPWQLQYAEAEIVYNTLPEAEYVSSSNQAPHLLYAERLEIKAWWLERVT